MSICENQKHCEQHHADIEFWRNSCAANGALLKEAKKALIAAAYWMPPASPMQDDVLAMIEKIKRYENE